MVLVTLTRAKKHLNLLHDDDDEIVGVYLAAAETIITEYIDRVIYGPVDDSPPGAPPSDDDGTAIEVTPAIQAAVLLLMAELYENREADPESNGDAVLPRTVRALLAPYRVWRVLSEGA